ncbi:hypothetical protein D9757_010139 [Collybiopsis confluens]|uniref:Glycosyl hydrolase family 30 TIM-barrel domain-containing protein n=1 Tax=Collybiopsis confluens TaxID=2823264 RepID=A0A8H5GT90_9AGAR|nr:hypothetical protein D9757_010139 [Collybiopsis confluens]
MILNARLYLFPTLILGVRCQQIYDIVSLFLSDSHVAFVERLGQWQTTWDRSTLFTPLTRTTSTVINFAPGTSSSTAQINIAVDDTVEFQDIVGFGGSLTDSSALTLKNLKTANSGNYFNLINYMFNPTDGANAAGLNYVRVPIGATDFSASVYSLDDSNGDTSLAAFNINRVPTYVFEVLKDIQSINPILKVSGLTSLEEMQADHALLTRSSIMYTIIGTSGSLVTGCLSSLEPAWMKDSGTMTGGSIRADMIKFYPTYLLKAVQGFQGKGIPVYAISIQNEPQNSNPTYPTCTMTPDVEAQIGSTLRSLLNSNGLSGVRVIGYEHNWNNAGSYPVTLVRYGLVIPSGESIIYPVHKFVPQMQDASNAFAGVGFHCYEGQVTNQDAFHNAFPSKEIYFTECSGTLGSDWWSDIKWYIDNLWVGALEHNARSGLMWNIALDGNGNPGLPGSNSCGGGCRGIVTISGGSYSLNQEFYSMAHASKAILPKDPGGPFGKRVGVSVSGSLAWALRVGAYVTHRTNPSDWWRYSLVVLNWDDNISGKWSPTPVNASISFRGMQATYTFPVGVTTLWWYGPPTS